jgi:hypothetical protein
MMWLVLAVCGASQSFALPAHGALVLELPPGWRNELRQPPDGLPPTIRLRPERGAEFALLLTPLWSAHGEVISTPAAIEPMLRDLSARALATSVETKAELVPIPRGAATVGWYFVLTDRAPKPGQFRYSMQGAVGVDDLQVMFTLLLHVRTPALEKQVLDLVASARHER